MRIERLNDRMKKVLCLNIFIVILLSCSSILFAQQQEWQPHLNGTDIYYNNGYVGIGTNAPESELHVNGNIQIDKSNFGGIYFGSDPIFIWRTAFGRPGINWNGVVLGWDGSLVEIGYDTIWDGAFAYCEGKSESGTLG